MDITLSLRGLRKADGLAALSENSRMFGRPRGAEKKRDTLPRLRNAQYNIDNKRRRDQSVPGPSDVSGDATQGLESRLWLGLLCKSGSHPQFSRSLRQFASRRAPQRACMRERACGRETPVCCCKKDKLMH
jgi:hypothetical protein